MKALKYLVVPWAAFAVYSLISLFYGDMGFSAHEQLRAERDIQQANLGKLNIINGDLEKAQKSLLYDSDAIEVYARQLGYSQENEQFIRIVGLGRDKAPFVMIGEALAASAPGFLPAKYIVLIAVFAGITALALLLAHDLLALRE